MKRYGNKKKVSGQVPPGTSIGPVSEDSRHVGGGSFPDGMPVCQPVKPGRRIKPLSGPVHPGFPKPNSAYRKKSPPKMKETPVVGSHLKVSDQNFDLYKPVRKVKPKIQAKEKGK